MLNFLDMQLDEAEILCSVEEYEPFALSTIEKKGVSRLYRDPGTRSWTSNRGPRLERLLTDD